MEAIGLIYTTFDNNDDAHKVVKSLMDQNYASCANIMAPHTAIYEWKGAVQEVTEIAVFIKCPLDKKERLISQLAQMHPYECPCILDIEASANPPYAQWLESERS